VTEASPATEPGPAAGAPKKGSKWREYGLQLVVIVIGYLVISTWRDSSLLGSGRPAPAFALAATTGEVVSLEQYRGKRVMLHFWATWCGVCEAEISTLEKLHASLADDEALLTIVDPSTDVQGVQQFVRDHGIGYPVLSGTAAVRRQYGVTSFPTNYFVTADGNIHSSNAGLSTGLGMRARLGCAR